MKLIDLARPLENTEYADPPGLGPQIQYMSHDQTVGQMLAFFPGMRRDELPGGEGWAVERVALSTHNGTHLDAPYHFHSTMDGGRRARMVLESRREARFPPFSERLCCHRGRRRGGARANRP
jgi:hypothetical protein